MKGIKREMCNFKNIIYPMVGVGGGCQEKERKRKKKKKEIDLYIYVYILPRSTRRISFLFIIDDNDDELAAFAVAGAL